MSALPTDLRNLFENAVKKAREVAEKGARQALQALAVDRREPHGSMEPEDRALRRRLRAHGRQLGDTLESDGTQTIERLRREVAYEHWHRMLFARFLAENHLLIEPGSGVAITMEECQELARERDEDPWALAASFAQEMLPQIFRADDPALQVMLPPETRQTLQRLLSELPSSVFTEDDSLGWVYQFWQAKSKDQVNRSEGKIGAEELAAVTQLFTEPYMVNFLLQNTLGAWWVGRHGRGSLPLDMPYLRFREDGKPTAGTFDAWPKTAAEITVLDPCCGSGHFLVGAFNILVYFRMSEEGLDPGVACAAVLRDNIHGLEIDERCTQIAAFALALAAWTFEGSGGHRVLPEMHIACSGLAPQAKKEEWLALADGESDLRQGMERLYELFAEAPLLGSLLDPTSVGEFSRGQLELGVAPFERLRPLIDRAASKADPDNTATHRELAVKAQGIARAAVLLGKKYTVIPTNVPYLSRSKQSPRLKQFCDENYAESKHELATVFVERCLSFAAGSSTIAVVTPQNWHMLGTYAAMRERLLRRTTWPLVVNLGRAAFRDMNWWARNTALNIINKESPEPSAHCSTIDLGEHRDPEDKPMQVREMPYRSIPQRRFLENPDNRIVLEALSDQRLLAEFAEGLQGIATADYSRFGRCFWEVKVDGKEWIFQQSTVREISAYGGREYALQWEDGKGALAESPRARIQGLQAWGRDGVTVSQMRHLPATMYTGEAWDNNAAVILPNDPQDLPAIWAFCSSKKFHDEVRKVDRKTSVTNATLVKVPFDINHWRSVAAERYPNGLPEPYSDDPTQWIFHGHPAHSEAGTELHVAVARLLGYRWPAELDSEMRLSKEARILVERSQKLNAEGFTDDDGIVCLSPVRGEPSASDRLRSLLTAAFGSDWSAAKERELLAAAADADHGTGKRASSLDEWLRESFFEEQCKLFHHRPFIWHVWDGLKEGFNVLVNYHRLAGPDGLGRRTLESLTFTYLGEWIERQRSAQEAGKEGADARLASALKLQEELQKILEGEPPYDLFVRWKPLHEQPMGWDPDINDGVVLNIRPFMKAEDVRYKRAGVLRRKPNVRWTKDRGKEPEELRPRDQFPWFWGCDPQNDPRHRTDFGADTQDATPAGEEFDGVRWNALHYTRAAKEAARQGARLEADA